MTEHSNSNTGGGVGFVGLLTLLFVGLKLTGYIDWDWWWVLSPIWITLGVLVVVFTGILLWSLRRG